MARRPSRKTLTRSGRSSDNAAAARDARSSCAKLKSPFTMTTTTMATASCGMPPTAASTAATHNISAKKWVNCLASFFRTCGS